MATIDATDLILGRLASTVAKRAQLGEKINVVNCEKAVITGSKNFIVQKYTERIRRGHPYHGPFFPKTSDMIMKRTIRGMVPHKKAKGRDALSNVMCYVGIPIALANEKLETIQSANVSKLPNLKYVKLGEVAKLIGGKR